MDQTKHKPLRTRDFSLQEIAAYIWNIFLKKIIKLQGIRHYFIYQIFKY